MTTDTTQATPRPWHVVDSGHAGQYKCVQIGSDPGYTTLELLPADAHLIVTAVNCHEDLLEVANAYVDRDRFDTVNSAHRIEIVAKWMPRIEELFPVSGTHAAHASWTQAAFRELPGRLAQAAIEKARGGAGK